VDIRYQEKEFEGATKETAQVIIRTVEAALKRDMELGRQEEVQKILELIAQSREDIAALRIISESGEILTSANKGEVRQSIPQQDLAFYRPYIDKHFAEAIIFTISPGQGKKELHVLRPIYNQPRCFRCHDPNKKINGILQLNLSLALLEKRASNIRLIFPLAAIIIVLVTGITLSLIIGRLVIQPLHQLREKMSQIPEGKWEMLEGGRKLDEIGELDQGFNIMVKKLEEREKGIKEYFARLVHSEKLAASGRVIAHISHEIKTPLSIIKNYLVLLKKGLKGDEISRERLKAIEEEVARLSTIVDNLLGLSRTPQGEIKSIQLNQLLQETITSLQDELTQKSIRLKEEIPQELPPIITFADQLKQVFINLIKNAIEAMKEGGELRISGSYQPNNGGKVIIAFTDNGCGIPERDINRVFEPFFSTKKETGGTGLGLWISYGIIQALGGHIEVKSQPGQGSTFLVTMPLRAF
jgi:signal transduction histidine kinase